MSIDVADFVSERIVGNREVGQLDGLSPNRGCAVIRLGMATDMERYRSPNEPCDYVPGISGYGRICDGALAQRDCFPGFLAERQPVEFRVKIHNQRVTRLKLRSC